MGNISANGQVGLLFIDFEHQRRIRFNGEATIDASDPLMAGFIGDERLAVFRGQPAVIAEKLGEGLLVRFANDPLFRGFWRGTEKLYINALYFGQVVESTELPEIEPAAGPDTPRQQ